MFIGIIFINELILIFKEKIVWNAAIYKWMIVHAIKKILIKTYRSNKYKQNIIILYKYHIDGKLLCCDY